MLASIMGTGYMGGSPLAGPQVYDLPTVVVDNLVTITVGPSFDVEWTYDQDQDQPQLSYRVVWTNAGATITYYDSGVIVSDDVLHAIDVSTITEPGAGEAAAGIVTVYVEMDAQFGQDPGGGTDTDVFTTELGFPHMTITHPDPGEVVTTERLTLAWTFADDRGGKVQAEYRIILKRTGDGFTMHDSGWKPGAADFYLIPINLNSGTEYTVYGQLKNDEGMLSD